jgi:hypothetical protein
VEQQDSIRGRLRADPKVDVTSAGLLARTGLPGSIENFTATGRASLGLLDWVGYGSAGASAIYCWRIILIFIYLNHLCSILLKLKLPKPDSVVNVAFKDFDTSQQQ